MSERKNKLLFIERVTKCENIEKKKKKNEWEIGSNYNQIGQLSRAINCSPPSPLKEQIIAKNNPQVKHFSINLRFASNVL